MSVRINEGRSPESSFSVGGFLMSTLILRGTALKLDIYTSRLEVTTAPSQLSLKLPTKRVHVEKSQHIL